jgi:hypothetical protein
MTQLTIQQVQERVRKANEAIERELMELAREVDPQSLIVHVLCHPPTNCLTHRVEVQIRLRFKC